MTPLKRVKKLLEYYQKGEIPTLPQHEVHPEVTKSSRENYLYFTLPCCINFQRSSPAMWQGALATYLDPETNYVFFPEKVLAANPEKVRVDLFKHRLSLQPNKHMEIWLTIAKTLHTFYEDDPRKIVQDAHYDAGKLIGLLQKEHRSRFPYLSGPKLSNYWPFILSQYTDVQFTNMHEISIIPDTHVIQSTIHLGLADPEVSSLQVETIWKNLLKDSGISPVTMHPVLWNWSRNNFNPAV
jgi:hypothetical protein